MNYGTPLVLRKHLVHSALNARGYSVSTTYDTSTSLDNLASDRGSDSDMEYVVPCDTCLCGREFFQVSALKNHQRSCQRSKKRLSSALAKAKDVWTSKKRKRIEGPDPNSHQMGSSSMQNAEVTVGRDTNAAVVEVSPQ